MGEVTPKYNEKKAIVYLEEGENNNKFRKLYEKDKSLIVNMLSSYYIPIVYEISKDDIDYLYK